ncbi:putative DNA topoisomerase [Coemansia spiralis]|nr:putative DNA topoisomerase [Coemansia spiralis]
MSLSDSDDGAPLSAIMASTSMSRQRKRPVYSDSDSDSDNEPLAMRGPLMRAKRKSSNLSGSDSGSESDQPLSSKAKPKANGILKAVVPNGSSASKPSIKKPKKDAAPLPTKEKLSKKIKKEKSSAVPTPVAVKSESIGRSRVKKERGAPGPPTKIAGNASRLIYRKPLIKAESSLAASSQNGSEFSEMEEDEYKWWLENKDNDGPKWQSLEHSGVLFPPDYEPHGVPLIYKKSSVKLAPPVEEVATFFAAILGTDHAVNKVFQKNFFDDFKEILDQHMPGHPIMEFKHCDFTHIRAHLDEQSSKRKAMTKQEKETAKRLKMAVEDKYSFCMLDGRREKVGNFRIEPPGLFRGRGAHPKTGKLKQRVMPEQVTINIGKDAKIPDPPPGHRWGQVCHDNTVTWLAMWKENINGNTKYVFLAAGSSLKGQSDMRKFDKARSLVLHIDAIREQYTKDLKSPDMAECQRATAMYLIDRFALRAGNEKSDDEADTVGCCSLRCEHIKLEPPNIVHFDFLGKDSIRYERTTEVDRLVWKNLRSFQKGKNKSPSDMLFDRLTTASLNKHLQTLMPGLTAKVFRTFNASYVFQKQLANTPANGTEAEKILAYNRANRDVAVLCNHQRSVSKGFQGQMTRIEDKLLAVRYQRMLLKKYLLEISPKLAKKRPDLSEREPGVTPKWIKAYLLATCELDRDKLKKKFERDNEKLQEAGEPLIPELKLKEQIAEINAREKAINDGTYEPEPPVAKTATTDKVLEKIDKLAERIKNIEVDKIEKDENKTTALSTSKLNYIDPRISIVWCKKYNVPIERIFNKTLREKFTWALEADKDWVF